MIKTMLLPINYSIIFNVQAFGAKRLPKGRYKSKDKEITEKNK